MAAVLWTVLHAHGLTVFEQAVIIATISATITGLFTVLGAWVATKKIEPMHDDVTDVKKKVGAANREIDHSERA